MMREFKINDIDKIMSIWLDTNVESHSFIEKDYWVSQFDEVKAMLPSADIYIYEEDDIYGFIGLVDNYIAGIFVLQDKQSQGIGKTLLDYVKTKRNKLTLNVYKQNAKAIQFYLRESFVADEEKIDKNTGHIELSMSWIKGEDRYG